MSTYDLLTYDYRQQTEQMPEIASYSNVTA